MFNGTSIVRSDHSGTLKSSISIEKRPIQASRPISPAARVSVSLLQAALRVWSRPNEFPAGFASLSLLKYRSRSRERCTGTSNLCSFACF